MIDKQFSTDGLPCRIRLDEAGAGENGWRSTDIAPNCAPSVLPQSSWQIEQGKIILRQPDGAQFAELGGEPTRLSGDFAGDPDAIVLEREAGSGGKSDLAQAISRHRCYFLGYSGDCAPSDATQGPEFSEGSASINVLVDLNVRSQLRRSAPTIGRVPAGSEIEVNLCFDVQRMESISLLITSS